MTKVTEFDIIANLDLSATIQDHLSLIYVMERDEEPVVGSRLAEWLGVKPPTVTNTLKRMVRDGLITMNSNGTHLTQKGWAAAKVVMRRHMLMEWMMNNTLAWSQLHREAHNLEHAISAMAENALMEQLGRPRTCPHGNPLPGHEDAVASWVPVLNLNIGETVTLRRVHELAEENSELLAYLEKNQVMPGVQATIVESLPFNQTMTISIEGKKVTLGYAVARYIFAERAELIHST
jgi:DtxR family Mn-dependent transcriptional regulator